MENAIERSCLAATDHMSERACDTRQKFPGERFRVAVRLSELSRVCLFESAIVCICVAIRLKRYINI